MVPLHTLPSKGMYLDEERKQRIDTSELDNEHGKTRTAYVLNESDFHWLVPCEFHKIDDFLFVEAAHHDAIELHGLVDAEKRMSVAMGDGSKLRVGEIPGVPWIRPCQ